MTGGPDSTSYFAADFALDAERERLSILERTLDAITTNHLDRLAFADQDDAPATQRVDDLLRRVVRQRTPDRRRGVDGEHPDLQGEPGAEGASEIPRRACACRLSQPFISSGVA